MNQSMSAIFVNHFSIDSCCCCSNNCLAACAANACAKTFRECDDCVVVVAVVDNPNYHLYLHHLDVYKTCMMLMIPMLTMLAMMMRTMDVCIADLGDVKMNLHHFVNDGMKMKMSVYPDSKDLRILNQIIDCWWMLLLKPAAVENFDDTISDYSIEILIQ